MIYYFVLLLSIICSCSRMFSMDVKQIVEVKAYKKYRNRNPIFYLRGISEGGKEQVVCSLQREEQDGRKKILLKAMYLLCINSEGHRVEQLDNALEWSQQLLARKKELEKPKKE